MHTSSLEHMGQLIQKYLDVDQSLTVIDIGSFDVNGSYKPLFNNPNWNYIGVDLTPGNNVDVVLESPYKMPFNSNSVDLVISGQAFEHVKFFWLTWLEMIRVLKPGGQIFLIAPSRGPEHQYPVDCWRFYPDGFRALAEYGNVETLEVQTDWIPYPTEDSAPWGDTVGVFRKPVLHQFELRNSVEFVELTTQLQKVERKLQNSQAKLQRTQNNLVEVQERIAAMETSKFWKLRKSWFLIKRMLHLPSQE